MTRVLFHLLLALSLFFNGVSIPWARAHMSHEAGVALASDMDRSDSAPHRHHHHADASDAGDATQAHDHGKAPCCSGGDCQCGCTMAPAVPLAMTPGAHRIEHATPFAFSAAPTVSLRGSPPFRPPAG